MKFNDLKLCLSSFLKCFTKQLNVLKMLLNMLLHIISSQLKTCSKCVLVIFNKNHYHKSKPAVYTKCLKMRCIQRCDNWVIWAIKCFQLVEMWENEMKSSLFLFSAVLHNFLFRFLFFRSFDDKELNSDTEFARSFNIIWTTTIN